jgi:ATP-dependent DNA ligase
MMKIKKFKYFYPEKPVLMQIGQDEFTEMSNSPKWIAEPKYNGSRCIVHLLDGKVEFWDRHNKKLDFDSNPLYAAGRDEIKEIFINTFGKTGYFVFDGELRHNKVRGIQCKLVIWDCFIWDHELLNKKPYWARRAMIEEKMKADTNDPVTLIRQWKHHFKTVYDEYVSGKWGDPDEFEGVVMKNLNGKLNLSRTSGCPSNWMYKVRKQTGRHRY